MLNNQIKLPILKLKNLKKATDYQLPEEKKKELLETQCTLYPQSQSKQNPSGWLIYNSPCFLSCGPFNMAGIEGIMGLYSDPRGVVMGQF